MPWKENFPGELQRGHLDLGPDSNKLATLQLTVCIFSSVGFAEVTGKCTQARQKADHAH